MSHSHSGAFPSTSETRYCHDCKHSVTYFTYDEDKWECVSPHNILKSAVDNKPIISHVTGRPLPYISRCSTLRNSENDSLCGKEGRWWEAFISLEARVSLPLPLPKRITSKSPIGLDDV